MLSHEAMVAADAVYGVICDLDYAAANGRQADALAGLHLLAEVIAGNRPILRAVIRSQIQAADALNLPQGAQPRILAAIGAKGAILSMGIEPAEHPDPANTHSAPPELPEPTIA